MEQRTGPSIQTVHGAAADPAFVPGIAPADARPEGPREPERTAEASRTAEPAEPKTEPAEADSTEAVRDAAVEDAVADGPVFEAADRRARIVADARGVRLSLDEESCDFRWDEIGAVESRSGRFGKRFTVIVHTPDRRWYPFEVQAPARDRIAEWESQLDAVLDAYFDENGGER
ncbi:hypothetical protein ACIGO8_03375 [Streptomyces sp. NPDC053493]|uniref:hypothetical protein n=1 Tax=Streptomyces sp. NPDC053493 TaxID=3365705 RepID=UPI0037D53FAD